MPEALENLENMAQEEHISKAELIRKAINFYNFKLRVKREKKDIILEDEDGEQTRILLV